MRSKARLKTNKAIMTKAHKEGGDLTSSERLPCTFLLLGIAEMSGDIGEIEPIVESSNESESSTYKVALESPQASEWKEAMHQEWQALVENHTFDIVSKGNNTMYKPMADTAVEEPIRCK